MKRITLQDIELKYKPENYQALYNKVISLINEDKLKPVKASKLNGKKPALYKAYWVIEEAEDRQWLILLNHYLKNNWEDLKTPQSMNERSFAIWHREKFLKEEQGKKILKRCGISIDMLNIYETTEPLAYK